MFVYKFIFYLIVNKYYVFSCVSRQPLGNRFRIKIAMKLSGQCVFVTYARVSRRPRNPIHVHIVDDIPRDLFSFIRFGTTDHCLRWLGR